VQANQKKHDRLEQELALEEGKLKALNTLSQKVAPHAPAKKPLADLPRLTPSET